MPRIVGDEAEGGGQGRLGTGDGGTGLHLGVTGPQLHVVCGRWGRKKEMEGEKKGKTNDGEKKDGEGNEVGILLHGLPNRHPTTLLGLELQASLEIVRHGLLLVLLLVEGLDAVAGVLILAELGFLLVGIAVDAVGGVGVFGSGMEGAFEDVDGVDLVGEGFQILA